MDNQKLNFLYKGNIKIYIKKFVLKKFSFSMSKCPNYNFSVFI